VSPEYVAVMVADPSNGSGAVQAAVVTEATVLTLTLEQVPNIAVATGGVREG
jgi:hypothetical protein